MTFLELFKFKEIETQNTIISIRETNNNEIEFHGHQQGMAKPTFNATGNLTAIEILIDTTLSDVLKSKVLLHELGHAYDYLNRRVALEEVHRKQQEIEKFKIESEYFAFEHSLQEAKKICSQGECDILTSLIERIKIRATNNNPIYKRAIDDIMKTGLWKECCQLVNINP